MLPTAHVEYTWAVLSGLQRTGLFAEADYRGVALAALLPDLIDKPLAIFALPRANATLLFAHTLLGHLLAWAVALCGWRRRALPYLLAFSGHLVADRIWGFTQTFLWPFKGLRFHQWRHVGSPRDFGRAYLHIIRKEPKLIAFEFVGLVVVGLFAHRRRLFQPQRLSDFLRYGRLESEGE